MTKLLVTKLLFDDRVRIKQYILFIFRLKYYKIRNYKKTYYIYILMAEIDEAFHKLSNQNKTFGSIEYFFTQRKVSEEQEYLDKSLNRKNKQVNVTYNFLAIIIPNILVDEITTGFNIEIFGDNGYHYKAFLSSYQGIVPHFLVPLKGDKKIFINILPKLDCKEKESFKYDTENIPFNKNYIAFIDVSKRFQTVEQAINNQLHLEEDNEEDNKEEYKSD